MIIEKKHERSYKLKDDNRRKQIRNIEWIKSFKRET